ncbi:MAG: glycosyltransferase family 2 protein [Vicinamibacteria bacterium]|nr:glycosyltransferase family 2 protein [Vicinamibacteria bacterium]
MISIVVPVYRNESGILELIERLAQLHDATQGDIEAVLVVDGSPDRCQDLLARALPRAPFPSQLITLSRNFGSFPAIVAGLAHARGDFYAVMCADLQEPPELALEFRRRLLSGDCDVVVGTRIGRDDPFWSRLFAALFWRLYRALVRRDIPTGGVDVFGCNRCFRDQLVNLKERNTTLIGLIFWLGFTRAEVSYRRQPRQSGRSAWTWSRRLRYLLDSAFAFSDLPVRIMTASGLAGMSLALSLAVIVLFARLRGDIPVPGYAATVLTVMFFGGLNSLGLGLIGEYLWRAFENTKGRPGYVVARRSEFGGESSG